jgi:hypothetical protein
MPPKRAALDDETSRKKTADLLRRLRELNREARMLKAKIETARTTGTAPRLRGRR